MVCLKPSSSQQSHMKLMENCLQIWQYKGIKVKFETAIDNFELISNLGLGNYVPSVK